MKKTIKRIFSLVVFLFMVPSLTGCFLLYGALLDDDTDDTPSKEIETVTQTETVHEEIFGLNESAVFSNLKFTATEFKESDGEGYYTPEKGNVFVGVKFTIENISDVEQSVSDLLLFEGYADDVKCAYSFSASCAFDEGTLSGDIAAGKKLIGWYGLEVPSDWSTIELEVQSSWLSNNPAKFVFKK